MKKVAVIIKHPGRDWESDVRIDIMDVPEEMTYAEIRRNLESQMLGPFEVLYLTEKINFNRSID